MQPSSLCEKSFQLLNAVVIVKEDRDTQRRKQSKRDSKQALQHDVYWIPNMEGAYLVLGKKHVCELQRYFWFPPFMIKTIITVELIQTYIKK